MTAADNVLAAVARLERIKPSLSRSQTLKDQIRTIMPAIEGARRRGLFWKEIHAEILAAGIPIEPQVLANYVCELRQEARAAGLKDGTGGNETPQDAVVVRLPGRDGRAVRSSSSRPANEALRGEDKAAAEGEPPLPDPKTGSGSRAPPEQYVETPNGDRPTMVRRPT